MFDFGMVGYKVSKFTGFNPETGKFRASEVHTLIDNDNRHWIFKKMVGGEYDLFRVCEYDAANEDYDLWEKHPIRYPNKSGFDFCNLFPAREWWRSRWEDDENV